MISPYNLSIKNYTEIFYLVNDGNVPSLQGKMRLCRSSSMGETDSQSLIFTDFNILALTSWLQWWQAMLELSGNITLFAVSGVYTCVPHKEGQVMYLVSGEHHLYTNYTIWGTGWNPAAPLLVFLLEWTFCLQPRLWIFCFREKSQWALTLWHQSWAFKI
jgi:hypothetical protein